MISLMSACMSSRKTTGDSTKTNVSSGADNDGKSFATAIVIKEKTESAGVDAEYKWLAKHYPGYKLSGQYLKGNGNKKYDKMDIVTADGQSITFYFDIDNFFGKL